MKRFLGVVLCATLAGLFYVYEEVEAVKIGYAIRKQEETRVQFLDLARALKYNIAHLKAPNNLERKLLAQHIVLKSPREWQTLVMSGPGGVGGLGTAQTSMRPVPFFVRFFVGTAQAEAKESSA